MIGMRYNEKGIDVVFGGGDIGIQHCICWDNDNNGPFGFLGLTNLSKSYKIGKPPKGVERCKSEEMEVVMFFTKTESIDVVIGSLERIKKLMIKELDVKED